MTSRLIPDNAHVPSLAYVPYLMTGDRYYADEMAFWANFVLLRTFQDGYSNYRGGTKGLLVANEVRGIAWACEHGRRRGLSPRPRTDPRLSERKNCQQSSVGRQLRR